MNAMESAPTFLTDSIFTLLIFSFAAFRWGRKTPGNGVWFIWVGLLGLLTAVGLDSGILLKETLKIKIWKAGWIWPRDEIGAITVGMYQDSLSLTMSALSAMVAGAFLLNKEITHRETHLERFYSALALSTTGVVLSWNSLTPWLSFAGMVLTIVGGFIALATRWERDKEATVAARFIWERSSGFLLAFFGACILATSRSALLLNDLNSWNIDAKTSFSTWFGSILLVVGLFVQMQPFPLIGWIVGGGADASPPVRILLNQIFPAWAAFSLLLRLTPQLQHLGLFPGFGWIALSSTVLLLFSGLFQNQWHLGLSAWLAAAFSLICAVLAFSGPSVAVSLLIGVSLGALCLSAGGIAFQAKTSEEVAYQNRATWVKLTLFLGGASGTGMLGYVSAAGGLKWLADSMILPGVATLFAFIYFLFGLLGWKLVWQIIKKKKSSSASWVSIFSQFIWIFLSLGIVWTGTVTGGVVLGNPDRLTQSLFEGFFGSGSINFTNATDFISASGLYWGAFLFAFIAAYWTTGRDEDRWVSLQSSFPKTTQFIVSGYSVDKAVKLMARGLLWFGTSTEALIDQKIWMEWLPLGLFKGVKGVSEIIHRMDMKITSFLESGLKGAVEVPAKALQLIQTGDVRWYLFLALSSGFALLSYFLKA